MRPKNLLSAFSAMDYRETLRSVAGTKHVTSSCGGVLLRIRLKPVSPSTRTVYVGILSFRTAVVSGSLLNQPSIGEDLARGAALGTAGLSKPDFFHYLWWLLNGRAVDVDEFKIAPGSRLGFSLFGTSDTTGSVISKTFSTYGELEMWADEALRRLLSTRR